MGNTASLLETRTVEITDLDLLVLKKIALIVGAVEKSVTAQSSKAETRALLSVLLEFINRAEVESRTEVGG